MKIKVEVSEIFEKRKTREKINKTKIGCLGKTKNTDKPLPRFSQKETENKLTISGIREVKSLQSLKIMEYYE